MCSTLWLRVTVHDTKITNPIPNPHPNPINQCIGQALVVSHTGCANQLNMVGAHCARDKANYFTLIID